MKLTKSDRMINWFTVVLFCFQVGSEVLCNLVNSCGSSGRIGHSQSCHDPEVVYRQPRGSDWMDGVFCGPYAFPASQQLDDPDLAESDAGGVQSDLFDVHQLG